MKFRSAVQAANVNLPTGTLYGKHQAFTILANGQLNKAEDYRPMIVAYRNGNPIRLEQLGRVMDSVQNDKIASWFNNVRAVVLSIQRQPGANTVQVVDDIKKIFPQLREQIPASVNIDILYDRSESIRRVGERRAIHPAADRCPRRARHLSVPAKSFGHHHSQPRAADVHHRHLRRDVPARLQPG